MIVYTDVIKTKISNLYNNNKKNYIKRKKEKRKEKKKISNLMSTTRFWNNIHWYAQRQKIGKTTNLKSLGASKLKGLNTIANFGQGQLCLKEEKLISK